MGWSAGKVLNMVICIAAVTMMPVIDVSEPHTEHGDRGLGRLQCIEPGAIGRGRSRIQLTAASLVAGDHDGDGREGFRAWRPGQQDDGARGEPRGARNGARLERLEPAHVDDIQVPGRCRPAELAGPDRLERAPQGTGRGRPDLLRDDQVVAETVLGDRRPELPGGRIGIGQ